MGNQDNLASQIMTCVVILMRVSGAVKFLKARDKGAARRAIGLAVPRLAYFVGLSSVL
ncbi:hypothetical protein [Roseinatronobacter alkalisoli]|uniref:Uncharacterized protein n=1 Tax=Roseinatronobacter alkalisoli TaxID=3028235 RepID=A0ABT5T7B6_9RHOB|nr:hypothetical protein [Roseinatronobacter sp. HJB301]MDD7971008.1 hypothetical protein [Roseinatronobacter sp. HJB301]